MLRALATLAAAALTLTGCTGQPESKQAVVGDNGADLTVAGVHIQIPAGAVPSGTPIQAEFDKTQDLGSNPGLRALADSFKLVLGNGLEPKVPLTVTVPIDKSKLIDPGSADPGQTIGVLLKSADGTLDAVTADYDASAGTVTAKIPHLSFFSPFQFDIGGFVHDAADAVAKGAGLKTSKPDCVGKDVTIDGTKFSVSQPDRAWVCVSDSSGNLAVSVTGNSPVPFKTKTSPTAAGSPTSDIDLATALTLAVMRNTNLNGGYADEFNGAGVTYTFDGAPAGGAVVGFRQDPAALEVLVLANVLDTVLGKYGKAIDKGKDALEKLGCLQNVVETTQTTALSSDQAGKIARSFFSCVGPTLDLSGPPAVMIKILAVGPQLLIGNVLGAVNEMLGREDFSVQVAAAAPLGTRFVTSDPWNVPNLVNSADHGGTEHQCSGSSLAERQDAFRCFAGNYIYDPCFQKPDETSFICLEQGTDGAFKPVILNGSATDTPNTNPPAQGSVWRIELTDGTTCEAHMGTGPDVMDPNYPLMVGSCSGPSSGIWADGGNGEGTGLYYRLYPHGAYWQAAVSNGTATKLVDVKTAYR